MLPGPMLSRISLRSLAVSDATHPWRRRWLGSFWYWFWQLLGWGLVGGLFTLAGLSASRPNLWVVPVAMFAGGLLCTHLLRVAILVLRAEARTWWGFVWRLTGWILLMGVCLTAITHGLASLFAPELLDRSSLPPLLALCVPVVETSVLFAGWTGFYLGIAFFRGHHKAELGRLELAAAVQDAELRVLKSQIDPHFLFNSLNTLRTLITDDPRQARAAVTLLADLLRAALTINTRSTILLRQELDTVRSYLALEQLRFEERLRVRWSVDPAVLDCQLPPSVLQTLVENALKHGIAPREDGGEILIEAARDGAVLRLTVSNPGRLGETTAPSTGIGLQNARGRLQRLCGEAATLSLEQRGPDLVAAVLALPVDGCREVAPATPAEPRAG